MSRKLYGFIANDIENLVVEKRIIFWLNILMIKCTKFKIKQNEIDI